MQVHHAALTLIFFSSCRGCSYGQEQLERLAPLGGLQDGTDRVGSKVEEGDEADGPPVRANSRRRRVQLSLPDNPAEIRDILDDLKQKNHADRCGSGHKRRKGMGHWEEGC